MIKAVGGFFTEIEKEYEKIDKALNSTQV